MAIKPEKNFGGTFLWVQGKLIKLRIEEKKELEMDNRHFVNRFFLPRFQEATALQTYNNLYY